MTGGCGKVWGFVVRRYYSLFTLGMLVMFECTVVGQRLRNLRELRSLTTPKQALLVYRQGKWVQLPGDALLPGDVISIGRPSGGTSAHTIIDLIAKFGQMLGALEYMVQGHLWCKSTVGVG